MTLDEGQDRLSGAYFDRVYESGLDPWGFDERWYEARKRALTVASLPEPRYRRAFEPGCAIGVLTSALAERCDELVAWDIHPGAVTECARRCAARGNVRVEQGSVPDAWPAGAFDLVVLSEVAYYLGVDSLAALVRRVRGSLLPGGTVIAVHWLGETDYPLSGTETHRRLRATLGLDHIVHHDDAEFVLDVWVESRP